jgi:sugar phosphate isomerase/epimerase
MTDRIRIGFSMHPRWVEDLGLKGFLKPLCQAGLSALEFELDDRLEGWSESLSLMEQAVSMGLELSFHAPYRPPHSLVGFAGERRLAIEQELRPILEIGENWALRTGRQCVLVVHAAVSPVPADPAPLVTDTVAYLKWVAGSFPHLYLALENNHPSKQNEVKIGVQRTELLRLASYLPQERLGICWDMGHDYLSQQQEQPLPEWFSRVIHVHLHDVDSEGRDHYPLVLGNITYLPWLRGLVQAGMHGIVVLELQGGRLVGWPMDRVMAALVASVEKIAREVA